MTEYLYKGYHCIIKKWTYGCGKSKDDGSENFDIIVDFDYTENNRIVNCSKVTGKIGQFVGLKDVNKKQIFDKVDVVKFKFEETKNNFIELTGTFFFDDTELRYQLEIIDNPVYLCLNYMFDRMSEFEIIKSIEE